MSQEPVTEQILRAALGFPKYALEYVLGFYIVLTDIEMTTLLILGVLVGIVLNPFWGAIFALTLWLILRAITSTGVGIANSLGTTANAIHQAGAYQAEVLQRTLMSDDPAEHPIQAPVE